ncbi:Zn-dependent protease, partial [Pseudomonas aeruginosa]
STVRRSNHLGSALAPAMPPFPSARFVPEVTVSPRPPRWRTGGLWR